MPAIPILFLGDLDAYRVSPLRVVTVGLNPSLNEFPAGEPFLRFPHANNGCCREPSRYLAAMSAYFRTRRYGRWFNAFEPLLEGMGSSYYEGSASTALHTDIGSPVATNPTWSQLDESDRKALEAHGGPLWHRLLEELRPQIVALSVARAHLERIEFPPVTDWNVIRAFEQKADGRLRSRPYELRVRWYEINAVLSLFVFGAAAQLPFGTLASSQTRKAGELVLEVICEGR